MRISTGMIFNNGVSAIQQRTSSLVRTQSQVSSGRRILTPSDDPVAAAKALDISQSQSINQRFQTTQESAKSTLGIMDSQLSSMNDLLTRVRELTVQAGNGALSAADRRSIASELRTRFDELVGLANSTDGTGQYLFSGYQGATKPFGGSVDNGVGYLGDDGSRTLQVSGARYLPVSTSGNDLFMRIKNGNGTFVAAVQNERSINTHSANIDAGFITDSTLWAVAPANIELRFWVDTAGAAVNTKGYAVGTPAFSDAGLAAANFVTDAANYQFRLSLNGSNPVTVSLPQPRTYDGISGNTPGTQATDLLADIQAGIDAALGFASPAPGSATAAFDASGRLVVTSNVAPTGSASAVSLSAAGVDTTFSGLFGTTPTSIGGLTSIPNQTFYDLVNKATGKSLFTGTDATAGGVNNTFTHAYSSGSAIPLSSSGPAGTLPFDLGARVVVTGYPATGDAFAIDRTNGGLKTSPPTITHANAVIDKGVVSDPVKWASAANSQNLEVRFWTDTVGGAATPGSTVGNIDLTALAGLPSPPGAGFSFTPGTDDTFQIAIDGNTPARLATIPVAALGPHTDAQSVVAAVQAAIDAAVATAPAWPSGATVSLDASNHLVVTANATGAGSGVAITADPLATGGYDGLFDGGTGMTTVPGATTGGVQTPGYAVASMVPAYPLTIGANPDNQLDLALNLSAAKTLSLTPGIYNTPQELADELQIQVDAAYPGGATVSLDSSNRLVITSNLKGPTSGVALSATATGPMTTSPVLGAVLGAPVATAGTVSKAGEVFYDLVDAGTGKSLYTGTDSATGASGTYTHRFLSNTNIDLSSPRSPAFDFGASFRVIGNPVTGDTFTIKGSQDVGLGNGYFITDAKMQSSPNMGSGIIGKGEVTDPEKWSSPYNSRQLEVRFWKDPADTSPNPPTYYDLVDVSTEKSLFTDKTSTAGGAGNSYTRTFKSGDAINFSNLATPYKDFGISVTINGTPASGDAFSINNSTSESIFDTLSNLIHAVEGPAGPVGSNSNADLQNKLGAALTSIVAAADNIDRVRADIGTGLSEIDDLSSVSSSLDLQYATTLSNLQDVDYSKAVTDLMRMQMELQAAQQSFTKVSQLSLFNYL